MCVCVRTTDTYSYFSLLSLFLCVSLVSPQQFKMLNHTSKDFDSLCRPLIMLNYSHWLAVVPRQTQRLRVGCARICVCVCVVCLWVILGAAIGKHDVISYRMQRSAWV